MLKRLLIFAFLCLSVVSCASWFTSSQEVADSPTVGGKQDSSDMLFGQAESSAPATAAAAPAANVAPAAAAPLPATVAPAAANTTQSMSESATK